MKTTAIFLMGMMVAGTAYGKVDLVTLPTRDRVQLTIYNSADLTLARESRFLVLDEGANHLQFSWENTLIDPTSLEMSPKAERDRIEITDLTFPPRVKNLGVWAIRSQVKAKVPVEISYLTSGLSWRAFYTGTLTPDERTMRLEGYVRVTNNSGEDYQNAQIRLIIGQVHLLDQIADLARRENPYGRPQPPVPSAPAIAMSGFGGKGRRAMDAKSELESLATSASMRPREITKEGLSEYFLYTIEGTETIPTGWSKRMISLTADQVPVVNLYKYEEERYSKAVVRFLSFKNDKEHKLGETPIPDGQLKVCRAADDKGHLSYVGQSGFKYIPVGQEVELNLRAVSDVVVEPILMEYKTEQHQFDNNRDVSGWDEVRTFKVETRNTRDIPVEVEIRRNFKTAYWALDRKGEIDGFEKVDKDTVKFLLKLPARSGKTFQYTIRTYHGTREQNWQK
jgi:hypothetical protein